MFIESDTMFFGHVFNEKCHDVLWCVEQKLWYGKRVLLFDASFQYEAFAFRHPCGHWLLACGKVSVRMWFQARSTFRSWPSAWCLSTVGDD